MGGIVYKSKIHSSHIKSPSNEAYSRMFNDPRPGSVAVVKTAIWKLFKAFSDKGLQSIFSGICSNSLALETYIQYMRSDGCSRTTGVDMLSYLTYIKVDVAMLRELFKRATVLPISAFSLPDLRLLDIASSILPYYLDSPFFDDWRKNEVNEAIAYLSEHDTGTQTTIPDLITKTSISVEMYEAEAVVPPPKAVTGTYIKDTHETEKQMAILEIQGQATAVDKECCSTVKSTFDSCDQIEWPRLLDVFKDHNWLYMLMAALETMPISLTISLYRENKPLQYPLIYFNKHFESLCRTKREDVIGMSVTFMQSRATSQLPRQQPVMAKLESDIKAGLVSVCALTCSCASLGVFENIIVARPIMGTEGKPTHIITLQKQARISEIEYYSTLLDTVMSSMT